MSELHDEGGMTFDQAANAIGEAVRSDADFTPGGAATMPEQPSPDQAEAPTPGADPVPDPGATEFASADAPEDSLWAGEDINPDLLPDELKPLAKQFEAAYTRKTQSLAEQRKQIEELGDIEQVRQAAELYESLKDPEFLKNFYGELGGVVQEMGLVDAPEAQPQVPEAAPQPMQLSPELQKLVDAEPELSPLAEQLNAMKQELDGFKSAQQQEREALEEERQLMAQAAEVDRQVQAVREQHPEYAEADWQVIYDFATAREGNVLEGAKAFEEQRERIISAYISQKQAAPSTTAPLPGGGAVTEAVEPQDGELRTFEDADRQAQAFLDANDLSEFTG